MEKSLSLEKPQYALNIDPLFHIYTAIDMMWNLDKRIVKTYCSTRHVSEIARITQRSFPLLISENFFLRIPYDSVTAKLRQRKTSAKVRTDECVTRTVD